MKERGFTLLEVLAVVSVLAILASVFFVSVSDYKSNLLESKLQQDVRRINAAVQIYRSNGGDLSRLDRIASRSPQSVLDQLKRRAKDDSAEQMAGFSGRMIDPRLEVVMQTSREARTDQPRAVWDTANQQFVITRSGGRGIKKFQFDERIAARGRSNRKEDRELSLKLAKDDEWVWDYTDRAGAAAPEVTDVTLGSGGTPSVAGLPSGLTRLDPPLFSIAGGDYPLGNFDLSLTLANPNDPGVSVVYYSRTFGDWQLYDGSAITVSPEERITAYAKSTDPGFWVDSAYSSQAYTVEPIKLQVGVVAPASMTYAEVGGAMMAGGVVLPVAGPGNFALNNAAAVPDEYENSSVFNIFWTYDGSSPLTFGDIDTNQQSSGVVGVYQGASFSGGFPGQTFDLSLSKWGALTSLPVKVAARSNNQEVLLSSDVVTRNVGINKMTLRAPTVTHLDGQVTISLVTALGDMPAGAQVFYTIDTTDPGVSSGMPASGIPYTGPFATPRNGTSTVTITARVYGPSGYEHWFTPSETSVTDVPVPPAKVTFSQSVISTVP